MARRLTGRPGALLFALLVLAVLLAHLATLQWMDAQWLRPSVLKPMAVPMMTRQLVQAAAAMPVAAVEPAPLPPPPPAVRSIPREATPTRPQDLPEPQSPPAAALPASSPTMDVATAATAITPSPAGSTTASITPPPTPAPAASAPATGSTTATATFVDAWPADTRLSYKLGGYFRGNLSGDAHVQWLRAGDRYEVRVDINIGLLASVVMTSQGKLTPQGLRPQVYTEERGNRRNLSMPGDEIVLSNGTRVPRPPGVQDTASQFVELTQQFTSGRAALAVGNEVSFPMARPGGVDFWTYDVTEKVMLDTPRLGTVEVFHLKPRPLKNPRGNITAEMWFAPSLQYLPVRIRVNLDEATYVDLVVDKIEQR